ncbi:MAG: hypothetical protein F2961_05800 [Actinobacteria bacterium]|nr:hypothetical protein [Actinomycetota bacterium]
MSTSISHWQRPHLGEHRFLVSLVVFIVIFLQFTLPKNLSLSFQKWICLVEFVILLCLYALSPNRVMKHHPPTRRIGFILTTVMTISNTASAVKLVSELISGGIGTATQLLASGGSIWLTNVVIFSLWFWDLDRGGPGARAEASKIWPDFLFPQMTDPSYAPSDWHPKFFDYLYMSFTNASAFSPTDVMPMTRWAKALMLLQSTTSLVVVGLVVARAVNILH